MNEFYVNNREVIKNLSLNTGTSSVPAFTSMCTTTEIGLTTDFEQQDWYVFCDAIQRSIITGAAISIDTTVKIDMNNASIVKILGDKTIRVGLKSPALYFIIRRWNK